MKKSDQLKQMKAQKAEDAQKILDNAAATAEDKAKATSLIAEIKDLSTQIDNQLVIEAALTDRPAAPPAAAQPKLEDTPAGRVYMPTRNLKSFKAETFGSRQDAEKAAYRSAKWLDAVLNKNQKSLQWCQENGVFAAGTTNVIYNVHEEGTNETGGYLVPDEWERSVIDNSDRYGLARQHCRVISMGSDLKNQPKRTGGLTAYARNESVAATESTKSWGNVQLVAKSWDVLTKYTRELSEDAMIGIADDLSDECGRAFAYAEDNSLFNGDASATYHGITGLVKRFFDASAASFLSCVTTATHDTFAEIDGDDLDKVVAAVPTYAKMGAAWHISPVGKALVFDPILRAAGGNTQAEVAAGAPPRYLGYPIITWEVAPNTAAEAYDEDPMVWFGNMSRAVHFGLRRGMTMQTLMELYATSGQIGLIASERFDINVHDVGSASALGPLAAYIGETS